MSQLTEDLERRIADLFDENTWLRDDRQRLIAERDQLQRDLARAQARCNRMAATAPIEDVVWRPTR